MHLYDYRIGPKSSLQDVMKQRLLLGKLGPACLQTGSACLQTAPPSQVAQQVPACCEAQLWKGRSEGLLASQQMLARQLPQSAPIYINNETKGLLHNSISNSLSRPLTPKAAEESTNLRSRIFRLFRSSPASFLAASSAFLIVATCLCSHWLRSHRLRYMRRSKRHWRRRLVARNDPYQSILANMLLPRLD